jgi:hemerythrin-like metal-binding protein
MSTEFVWDPDKLALHVEPMDAEHRRLIELMNRLQQLYLKGAPAVEQGKAFAALAEFTQRHFEHEEAYMLSVGYPGLNVHKGVHRNLMEKLNEHAVGFRQNKEFTEPLFQFLHMWLRAHICGVDMKYAAHAHCAKVASA